MSAMVAKKSPIYSNHSRTLKLWPLSKQEEEQNVKNIVKIHTHRDLLLKDKKYVFDRVFKPASPQIELYLNVIAPLIQDVVAGYNCTVFAYGQTGTGKTFTMTGDKCSIVGDWRKDDDAGVIPRAAFHIFDELQKLSRVEMNVKVSYIELYNEEIRDLLSDDEATLNLYSDTKGTLFIQGLKEISVHDSEGICKMLQRGIVKRQIAPTLMNHQSSRSHTVFTISVNTSESTVAGEDILKAGKINLVDLAGSENIARSGCKDLRAMELANINRSLLTLGRVIHALADKTQKHVPYRDSKLTRILQDSLGGHTKTVIIATVSPAHTSQEETASTLDYATRARDIKNTPTINEKLTKHEMLEGLVKEIDRLQKDLDAARTGTGFYVNKENYQRMLDAISAVTGEQITAEELDGKKAERIQNLEHIMQSRMRQFDETVEQCKKHQEELEKAKNVIKEKEKVLEQEQFLSKWYENHSNEKFIEAQSLLMATNMLNNEKEILLAKLEKQFTINVANETVTQSAVRNMLNIVDKFRNEEKDKLTCHQNNEIELKHNILQQKIELESSLMKIKSAQANLDTESVRNFSVHRPLSIHIKEHSEIIQKKLLSLEKALFYYQQQIESFEVIVPELTEGYTVKTKNFFTKASQFFQTNTLSTHNSDMIKRLTLLEEKVQEKKRIHEKNLKEFEAIVAITKSEIEDDAFMLSYIETMKENVTLFEEKTDTETRERISELESFALESIKDFQDRASSIPQVQKMSGQEVREVMDSVSVFVEKLDSVSSCLDDSHKKITQETLDYITQSLVNSCLEIEDSLDKRVCALVANVDLMIETTGVFVESFDSFVVNIKDELTHQILEKNVRARHAGDTPIRQSMDFPLKIKEFAPRETLIEKFKQTFPQLETHEENA